MERLYISDLDGTLLTPEKTISPRTREAVNRAIAAGEGFSVATARSASTVVEILQGIQLNLPVVLMNGVFLYDIAADRYLDVQTIPREAAQRMLDSIEGRGQKAFVYGFDGKMVVVHHKGIDPGAQEVFFHEREDKPFKRCVYTEDFGAAVHQYPVVSFVMIDSYGQLQPIYEEVAAMPELHASFYEDIYCPGAYYLEITSSGASKAGGVRRLMELTGARHITAFGDNLNDLSMLALADEPVAVANAALQVKEMAKRIIGSNQEDGVAQFLEERCGLELAAAKAQ